MKYLNITAKIKDSENAPGWVTIFQPGWNELADGTKYFVDKEAFDMVLSKINERGNEIVWDYEHQTLENVQAPAAGWIKEIKYCDEKGITARVSWTERAAEYLKNREYRYYSPVFVIRKADKRVCALHSVALTNSPKTNNLSPITAKLNNMTEEKMDREKLIEMLELQKDCSDKEITAAIAKLGVKFPEAEETLPVEIAKALELKEDDSVSVAVASVWALKQSNGVSREEFQALQDQLKKRDADEAVQAAVAKGKITPAQKQWADNYAANDLEGFKMFIAKAPVVVPVGELPGGPGFQKPEENNEAALQVAKLLGVETEDLKKYGEMTNG